MTQHPKIGRYELLTRLGLGGMAEVWVARQRSFGGFERMVALKRILPRHTADPRFVSSFANEAQLAAKLSHPHIAQIYDLEEVQGELLIAMELVRGETLQAMIRRAWELTGAPIPPAIAAAIVARVCRALHHAHTHAELGARARGIVHRDVNPANVLVGFRGEVKVVDFGIAKALDGPTAGTGGKVAYLSPEQARGEDIDARSDVFATGIMLWELCTGMRLFGGLEAAETRALIGSAEPARAVSEARPGVDVGLATIATKALAKDRASRFHDAEAMADALELWAKGARADVSDAAIAAQMGRLFRDRLELWVEPSAPVSEVPDPTLADAAPPAFGSLLEAMPELAGLRLDTPGAQVPDPTDPDEVAPSAPPVPVAPPVPIAVAPPAPALAAARAPVAAPAPVAARAPAPAHAPVAAPAPARAPVARRRRERRGIAGHLITMLGAVDVLFGALVLPWQHFELADVRLASWEVSFVGLVIAALGGATFVGAAVGLATGKRHRAAQLNLVAALLLLAGILIASAERSWGADLMPFESIGLQIGVLLTGLGALVTLGGALGVLGSLPRWDETSALLRLRVERPGVPSRDLILYEPQTVDLAALLAAPGLPSFRVTREGDARLTMPAGSTLALNGVDARADRPLRIYRADRGQVTSSGGRIDFGFVRPIAGRSPTGLVRWTETLSLGLLALLLLTAGGLYSVLAGTAEPVRVIPPDERRSAQSEVVIAEDKKPEEQIEVLVDLAAPKPEETEKPVAEEQKFGDERVADVHVEPRPQPRAVVEVPQERPKATTSAKDELMNRLAAAQDASLTKLASLSGELATNPGRGTVDVLDSLPVPDGSVGFAKGTVDGPTGPATSEVADAISKKLTNPPKQPSGVVRGKVTGMKSATKVTGQLDPGKVYSVIDGSIAKIQACYENRLQFDASLAGRITFRWTVTPTGSVTGVQQNVSTVADPKVATCIKAVIERLRFPKPEGGSVEISYPFIFRSS